MHLINLIVIIFITIIIASIIVITIIANIIITVIITNTIVITIGTANIIITGIINFEWLGTADWWILGFCTKLQGLLLSSIQCLFLSYVYRMKYHLIYMLSVICLVLRGYCTSYPQKLSKLSTSFWKIISASYSKLSKELENSIKIKVGQVVLELLTQNQHFDCFDL